MAKTSTNVMRLDYPADVAVAALSSPEFQEENFKNQGNPDAHVEEVSRTDTRLELKAKVTEYAKGVTGVDKSRTEQTTTDFVWDLEHRTARWTYDSPHGDRVIVSGDIKVDEAGQGCQVTEHFNVEVRIPLMGGKIEKMVIQEVESYYPKYEALLKKHCSRIAAQK
jgi:hypothetical protein